MSLVARGLGARGAGLGFSKSPCPRARRPVRNHAEPQQQHTAQESIPELSTLAKHVQRKGKMAIDRFEEVDHLALLEDWAKYLRPGRSTGGDETVEAARNIRDLIRTAVNTKAKNIRQMQGKVLATDSIQSLLDVGARMRDPAPFEALQILCYRNTATAASVVKAGGLQVARDLLSSDPSVELTAALCFLLSAVVAFNEEVHNDVMESGVLPRLVFFMMSDDPAYSRELQDGTQGSVKARAAGVLRNMCHGEAFHDRLKAMGAVDALGKLLEDKDPATRINSAVALACLVGKDEGAQGVPVLDQTLVCQIIEVLGAAVEGRMAYGTFWTVWKLAMGLSALSVPDANKETVLEAGGVEVLGQALFVRHHENERTQRYVCMALWNLAFNDKCRREIIASAGVVDALREVWRTSESGRTKEAAKGALWTLGLKEDVDQMFEAGRFAGSDGVAKEEHIMLSYEWGSQQKVLLVRNQLAKAGYRTWMDVDRMSGSTLEAMADAVERSAVVLVCVSKRYKESQACRTEAEYAFQQKKRIIPLLMESDYRPSGWLGALLGTKLYFNMSTTREVPQRVQGLLKEIGDVALLGQTEKFISATAASKGNIERADQWDEEEVAEWLVRCGLQDHLDTFQEHAINGTALAGLWRMAQEPRLFDEVLVTHLGIHKFGERLRLMEELARVFE